MENFFGKKLDEEMRRLDITQKELASRLGVNQPLISNYIHGKYTPRAEMRARIAEALKLPEEIFIAPPPDFISGEPEYSKMLLKKKLEAIWDTLDAQIYKTVNALQELTDDQKFLVYKRISENIKNMME